MEEQPPSISNYRHTSCQKGPISIYLLILVSEVVFSVIKSTQNVDKLRIFR